LGKDELMQKMNQDGRSLVLVYTASRTEATVMQHNWFGWKMGAIALSLMGVSTPLSCGAMPPAPSSSAASPALTAQAESPVDLAITAIEQAVFEQINAHRQAQGLDPLGHQSVIATQSRQHSEAMAQNRRLSHDGFQSRVGAIAQTLTYRGAGENVASNQGYTDPATQAVQGWLNSPGHRQNIEGNFDATGIGVAQAADGTYYLTQIFILSR
jgi:uncharacterized protein YkwD